MMLQETFKNKTVFITGHTGFKGSWMSMLLKKLGAKVVGYSLAPPTNPSLYKVAKIDTLIDKSYIEDITDYTKLFRALNESKPDMVIHLAAQALVKESYSHPIETYATNVMGTVNLLEAVRYMDSIKVVLNVTTDKCYENKEWLWAYRENERMGGYDPYSNSKSCSELVTSSFRNSFYNPLDYGVTHHIALASARAGNVIGGGDWAKDRLIPDFIKAIVNNSELKIRSPHAIRPWQHVLEPLIGYLYLCTYLWSDGVKYAEGWNFGPNEDDVQSVEWIAQTICRLWGEDASYNIDTNVHPHEATYLKLDCSKAKLRLNWKPKWNLKEALQSIVEWNKAYLDGQNMRDFSIKQIEEYLNKN